MFDFSYCFNWKHAQTKGYWPILCILFSCLYGLYDWCKINYFQPSVLQVWGNKRYCRSLWICKNYISQIFGKKINIFFNSRNHKFESSSRTRNFNNQVLLRCMQRLNLITRLKRLNDRNCCNALFVGYTTLSAFKQMFNKRSSCCNSRLLLYRFIVVQMHMVKSVKQNSFGFSCITGTWTTLLSPT